MSEVKFVREYETIIGNKEYEERYDHCIDEENFNSLIDFIKEYKEENDSEDVLNFMKIIYNRGPKEVISIQNYVGLIQFKNGYKIQILPKIDLENKSLNNIDGIQKETQIILWKMLSSMHDFPSKSFNIADIDSKEINLYEIFIRMYISELSDVIKKGIISSYSNKNENINTIKGKILMNRHIQKNIIHKEKFYCNYDEYNVENPENRIIKATLLKLLKFSKNSQNVKIIKRLILNFENVSLVTNYDAELKKYTINRQNKQYEFILKWSKIFLCNKSFTNFSGENTARALLFKMDRLFEAYVSKRVRQEIKNDFKVYTQNQSEYLFDIPKKRFGLKPDIIIKNNNNEVIAILDTKWKRLSNKYNNYDISKDDMYQMYVYAKKYKTNNIFLIYPLNTEMKKYKNGEIYYKSDDGVNVTILFVEFNVNSHNRVEDNIKNIIEIVNK